jgi:Lysozyme like domain
MSVVSDAQIAQYIRNAGATDQQVPTMVAIALAESGGNTSALGDVGLETSTWGPSVGLWQIRSLNSERGTGGVRDQNANLDPQMNANHAMAILGSQGLSAWSTYTSQKYRLFLSRGTSAASQSPTSGTVQTVATAANPFTALLKIFTTLTDKGMWERIGIVLFGAALIYIGIIMLIKGSGAYGAIDGAAKTVAKVVK